mmetsp:Transcript_10163/g.13591  ORF Transcript_10163/g.13591 Transcript_10163/m.13591 type:complete len:188 (+) Transcript_10163:192-755(+)
MMGRRFQDEMAKRRKWYMIDLTMTVSQRENSGGKVFNNKSFEIKDKKGTREYLTDSDAPVSICVRSLTASAAKASRFSLEIKAFEPVDEEEEKKRKEREKIEQKLEHSKISRSLNSVEGQIRRMLSAATMLEKNADLTKEEDVKFWQVMDSMHSSSLYWPLIQLVVLIVTGYIQAQHLLRYIKRRGF